MLIDRLLARFSIQTKVIVFITPLIGGIAGLAAINLYTGSMLGEHLDGTSASIESLSGFQRAYAGMNEFLGLATEEKRDEVISRLDAQVDRMESTLALATNSEERDAINRARDIAASLRADVDGLWTIHGEETATRGRIVDALSAMNGARARLATKADSVEADLANAETEAKSMLRDAERLNNAAQSVVNISTAISRAANPEEVFAAAKSVEQDIVTLNEALPQAIPISKMALRSTITDNFDGILRTLKIGVVNEPGMINLQKFANGLRPTGIQLQGLASSVARSATTKFSELDEPIIRGQSMISQARASLSRMGAIELAAVQLLGNASEKQGTELADRVRLAEEGLKSMQLAPGGDELFAEIGGEAAAEIATLPALASDLVTKVNARNAAFGDAASRINDAWASVLEFAGSQRQGAATVKNRASGITLSASAIAGLGSVLAAILLIAALKGPILRLVNAMGEVARGNLEIEVAGGNRSDEIGQMARALDVFKANAIDKIRVEGEGETARSVAAAERERSDREKARAEAALQTAVDSLGEALRNLAQGDLVSVIETPFEGNLDSLRVNFNESIARMRGALGQIRDNATSIQHNSAQMRSAADDLATRTEQQAASLEKTASSVDQISSTVQASSERVADTNKLALETCEDAEKSSQIVSRAIEAMGRIEEASGKINQIISVIDEIAFQTNLLALNAGVEAARAGEAGRGFAVVAQEVRELAGRSALAAKEIKNLISSSDKEVRNGVSLVDETGSAISRINERIKDISSHVQKMAVASREQAMGLGEINLSVNQMDRMTQQNAAMVEETSAASHTLAQEATSLSDLVAAFRLEGHAAASRPDSRAA